MEIRYGTLALHADLMDRFDGLLLARRSRARHRKQRPPRSRPRQG